MNSFCELLGLRAVRINLEDIDKYAGAGAPRADHGQGVRSKAIQILC
jgi:hypothetical protein